MYQIYTVSPACNTPPPSYTRGWCDLCHGGMMAWFYSPAWFFVDKLARENLLASGATNVSESCELLESVFISILKAAVILFFSSLVFLVLSCWVSLMGPCWLEFTHLFCPPASTRPNPVSLLLLSLAPSIRPSTRWCHLWWRCQRMNPRRRRGRIRSSDKWTSIMMVRGGNGSMEGWICCRERGERGMGDECDSLLKIIFEMCSFYWNQDFGENLGLLVLFLYNTSHTSSNIYIQ